jgi:hypothetical protein
MYYFAYGSNLNAKAVAEWAKHFGHRVPAFKQMRPAVLDNYRLCFPIFSEYWGGGIGDIEYDAGKYVMGGLVELTEPELAVLDDKVGRRLDSGGKEIGVYKHVEVTIAPLGAAVAPVRAITYQGVNVEKYHIPPTKYYMDLLLQGAYDAKLSMMWISYLQSFSTQAGRKPRPPK